MMTGNTPSIARTVKTTVCKCQSFQFQELILFFIFANNKPSKYQAEAFGTGHGDLFGCLPLDL